MVTTTTRRLLHAKFVLAGPSVAQERQLLRCPLASTRLLESTHSLFVQLAADATMHRWIYQTLPSLASEGNIQLKEMGSVTIVRLVWAVLANTTQAK